MKYLIILSLIVFSFSARTALAQEWYEGSWVFDATQTHKNNPLYTSAEIAQLQAGFDKHAGKITVNSKRIKGTKKAKLGVPYRVIWKNGNYATVEMKGAIIELVKAANPDLRKTKIHVKVYRLSYNTIAFEVPEMDTIRMYMRRVN